ncbi:MAG: hypothetical protein QOE86_171 [Solirubrobacteraceae bacterium]|nr:hypothetical protein [Solirubrobacteraceae bacterium]
MRRRAAAVGALGLGAASLVLAAGLAIDRFPQGVEVLACLVAALAAASWGIRRRGFARDAGLVAALALLVASFVIVIATGGVLGNALVLAAFVLAVAAAAIAFRTSVKLPPGTPVHHPVLFYNPKSGGGKAVRFDLPGEARARGIEPIELHLGDDLEQLVRAAVDRGADALAMAGGDGSQAVVASVAAETGLPYACIPAGTRNHFALDLGVDRDDVVGALDAIGSGGEQLVDLAEVNGRVFVNNVSLGLYAVAVEREGYREAKLRTIADTVPDVLGPGAQPLDLHWDEPGSIAGPAGAAALLVSNNRYRLGRLVGSGTRPRLDAGRLGVAVLGTRPGDLRQWTTPAFDVTAEAAVPAGIDGETVLLTPPLHFRSRPHVLRVRIAPRHPGASPSAAAPEGTRAALQALLRIAAGRST